MQHHVYGTSDDYPIAILVKKTAFNLTEIERIYIEALNRHGVSKEDIIIVALDYDSKGKASQTFIKTQLPNLMSGLASVGTRYVYCADANYFKVLTKSTKAEPHLGYVLKCAVEDYDYLDVILGVNHKSLIHNPANEDKLNLSIDTLVNVTTGNYQGLGHDIIQAAYYPGTLEEIKEGLASLYQYDKLSADLETGSLDFEKAGIGTITFCWNQHEGMAFACDYRPFPQGPNKKGQYGELVPNPEVRHELKLFLHNYPGTLIWHNAPYDLSILIYELWMTDLLDTEGLLTGLETLTGRFHDTKIIAYLATNSTGGNELGLKQLAHLFAGNWAQDDIKDITKIPLDQLLEYNLVDGLATNYVFDKYYPIMVQDDQEGIYYDLMLPSQKTIIQIEMTGMPLDIVKVRNVRNKLERITRDNYQIIAGSPTVQKAQTEIRIEARDKANAKLKTKQHPLSKFEDPDDPSYVEFNPGSGDQLRKLLYDLMDLPKLDFTKTKLASTGTKTLKKLRNHTKSKEYVAVINAIIDHQTAEKILNTFIPAFERAIDKGDGVVWLHGSFNLGGTVSGRLSSSNPNLQNIPAGSVYGKLIKECFRAPEGWIFCGADFNSLEDYISALTTKDPNKLKVYLDGYDGHCLRAFSYFPDRLSGIVDTVESINSIKQKFPEVRQDSKGPTFLETYGGTHYGLMKTLGFSKDEALRIHENYHELYQVSDQYVKDKMEEASKTGFVEVAFGLRLRTPLLAQTLRGNRATPYEAEAEARTAGNALGQSYGLLNNRAANAFMQKVWDSPYREDIKPVALIHDAIYLIVRDNPEIVTWVNERGISNR